MDELLFWLKTAPVGNWWALALLEGITLAWLGWTAQVCWHDRRAVSLWLIPWVFWLALVMATAITPPPGPNATVLDWGLCVSLVWAAWLFGWRGRQPH
jgi:hypothetical protein